MRHKAPRCEYILTDARTGRPRPCGGCGKYEEFGTHLCRVHTEEGLKRRRELSKKCNAESRRKNQELRFKSHKIGRENLSVRDLLCLQAFDGIADPLQYVERLKDDACALRLQVRDLERRNTSLHEALTKAANAVLAWSEKLKAAESARS